MRQQKFKVILLDSDPISLKNEAAFVKKTAVLRLVAAEQIPQKALHKLLHRDIDILLIDIDLPDISLLEFLAQIKFLFAAHGNRRPLRVLVCGPASEKPRFAPTDTLLDYLVKPYSYDSFMQAVHKVLESWDDSLVQPVPPAQLFLVYHGPEKVKINFDEIIYLQAEGMYCRIWLSDSSSYTVPKPMLALLDRLPADQFKRCHRSYAVNIAYVTHVGYQKLLLKGIQQPIPIGDRKINIEFDLWDKTNSL